MNSMPSWRKGREIGNDSGSWEVKMQFKALKWLGIWLIERWDSIFHQTEFKPSLVMFFDSRTPEAPKELEIVSFDKDGFTVRFPKPLAEVYYYKTKEAEIHNGDGKIMLIRLVPIKKHDPLCIGGEKGPCNCK